MSEGGFGKPTFLAVLSLLLLVSLAFVTTVSPLFHAKTIAVQGETQLKEGQILEIAKVDTGTNILWLSGSAVSDRLEAEPWIASAKVTKRYPSTLTIVVAEHRAVAQMGTAHDWTLIGEDGSALQTSRRASELPEIQGAAAPGLGSRDERSTPAAKAVAALTPATLAAVERVIIEDDGTLRMILRDGGKVEYGSADQFVEKGQAIGGVVTWSAENGAKIKTLDVTAPSAPAAKVTKPLTPDG
jgi:cell division protein FtsQ